jgi:hypothetical protein
MSNYQSANRLPHYIVMRYKDVRVLAIDAGLIEKTHAEDGVKSYLFSYVKGLDETTASRLASEVVKDCD